jgi:predicted O-methyltransferase YrrM
MEWKYNEPTFECDEYNHDLLSYAPWSGHRNFAYDFMNYYRPKVLVELGSHYGCSAFAFAQAAKDFKLDTKLCFVDTWQGDDFTKKYNNDVYTVFSKTVEECYKEQNINMLRKTFDEAVADFEDGSINVLHIDGSHYYDDVKRDFETWLPKVASDGIIILHDISSDIVLGDVMGSYKYWNELQQKYHYTYSFDFSWGLGIIFLNSDMYGDFVSAVDGAKYQRKNNALDVEYKDQLRKNHFALQDKQIYIDDLLKQKEVLNSHLEAYKKDAKTKDDYIWNFERKSKEELKNSLEAFENEKKKIIADYEATIKKTEDSYKLQLENTIKSYKGTMKGKDGYISQLEEENEKLRASVAQLEEAVRHPLKHRLNKIKAGEK